MGVLTPLFRLPFLPIQGVVKIGEIVRDQAEGESHDPATVRRQLEDAEAARASGEASDADVARMQEEAVGRLVTPAGGEPRLPEGNEPRPPAGDERRLAVSNRPRRTGRRGNRS